MIETGLSNPHPKEKDTDTFLTGTNIEDADNENVIDNIENS